ncbi:hypothetical protein V6N12_068745 [Hibiscus sabdariffa]|uniref:C3H1-type domain-containing protein n=1 Tax=Hibiscus sabdariffa TaxID=183260 RepID=A0ABR2FR67_9ROSI
MPISVIRHPRYKTEVCRMVLAGDVCPYGHRCHFRHALTKQEKFMDHLKQGTRGEKIKAGCTARIPLITDGILLHAGMKKIKVDCTAGIPLITEGILLHAGYGYTLSWRMEY